jgi:uncharacterized protein (DUF2141 family)
MRNFLLTTAGLVFLANFSYSQITLKIEISDLRNNEGKIMLQIFDEKETVVSQQIVDINKDKSCRFIAPNLSAGKYAVRFYHDENLNQKMETNMVGKPSEGYGFSNNVTGKFSMPPFKKWIFSLTRDTTIVLKTVY